MRLKYLFTAGLLGLCCAPLMAQTATSPSNPNNILATVAKVCTISAFTVDFGTYDASSGTAKTPTGTPSFTVRCSNTTPYTLTLGTGLNPSGGVRRMENSLAAGNFLDYNLSLGSTAGTGTGAAQTITVTGSIPINQFVAPGPYRDTVVVTVTY